jgi:hypothetical protein
MPLVIAAYWTRRPGPSPNRDVRQPIQGLVEVVESHLSQRGSAWPTRQRRAADWSMPPVGAWAMVFSALTMSERGRY